MVFLSCRQDFPFDTTRSLEFALFRTFCAPGISTLLDSTKEFEHRAQKRYDDTDILISEIMEHGYDSERGRRAIKRMNALHGRFAIAKDNFLYVLSTFAFAPIRWNERFGWRRMIEKERLALFHFWRAVGHRMNIHDIPECYADFEQFNLDYEKRHHRYNEANHRVGLATRNLFMSWFPSFTRPFVRHVIHAMMDESLLEAFGFPKPSPWLRRLTESSLQWRARLLRLLPRRTRPLLRTRMKRSSYPCGNQIEKIGPPEHCPRPPAGTA